MPEAPADKTTIVFSLDNQPGALFKALSVFALRDLDLTKVESRPIRGRPWEYLFYIDIPVSRQDLRCARALVHLAEFARTVRTLGSLPELEEPRGRRPCRRGPGMSDTQFIRTSDVLLARPAPRGRPRHAQGASASTTRSSPSRSSASPTPGSRSMPVQLPPARAGRAGEGGHPRGRRHADGVQHRSRSPTASRWAPRA